MHPFVRTGHSIYAQTSSRGRTEHCRSSNLTGRERGRAFTFRFQADLIMSVQRSGKYQYMREYAALMNYSINYKPGSASAAPSASMLPASTSSSQLLSCSASQSGTAHMRLSEPGANQLLPAPSLPRHAYRHHLPRRSPPRGNRDSHRHLSD